jgi:integrase
VRHPGHYLDRRFRLLCGEITVDSKRRRVSDSTRREARVTVISPNEFRHSAATLLSEAGIPIQGVADMLGHEHTRMLAKRFRHRRGVVDLTEGQDRMFGSG